MQNYGNIFSNRGRSVEHKGNPVTKNIYFQTDTGEEKLAYMNIDCPENMEIEDTIVGNYIQMYVNILEKKVDFPSHSLPFSSFQHHHALPLFKLSVTKPPPSSKLVHFNPAHFGQSLLIAQENEDEMTTQILPMLSVSR